MVNNELPLTNHSAHICWNILEDWIRHARDVGESVMA